MKKSFSRLKDFLSNQREQGATMVEYALMVALIALALIASVKSIQGGIEAVFTEAATEMKSTLP